MKKGTLVFCPECGKPAFRLTRDLEYGDPILASTFEPVDIANPKPVPGEAFLSLCCEANIMTPTLDGTGARFKVRAIRYAAVSKKRWCSDSQQWI